jgi:transcription elongation factor GreA
MSASDPETEAITAEGLEALKAQLHELETTARYEHAERTKTAREMGDLRENAEYHMAKDAQAHLETKIRGLQERLRKAVVTEVAADDGTFSFGRTAEVLDETSGRVHEWTIVGATEADLAEGRLSAESPVARALTGRSEGERVTVETPRGERSFQLRRLLP